jgi:hypothetical protein
MLPPHDCVETVLVRLLPDVREAIIERARVLDLPMSKVVTAMLIVQQPPSQSSPQVPYTARPEKKFITWQTFKRRWQQGSEVVLPDAAPSSTAPIPGTASLDGGQVVNSRPNGSWSSTVVESTLPTQRR